MSYVARWQSWQYITPAKARLPRAAERAAHQPPQARIQIFLKPAIARAAVNCNAVLGAPDYGWGAWRGAFVQANLNLNGEQVLASGAGYRLPLSLRTAQIK